MSGGRAVPRRPRPLPAACLFLAAGLVFGPSPARAVAQGAPEPAVYEYTYPYNTANLNENHFIVLDSGPGGIRGWYYGTSDDFDPGREGYLPGFFVAEMDSLVVGDGIIRFRLDLAPEHYFGSPVPLRYRTAAEVPPDRFDPWEYGLPARRRYRGTITADRIVLDVDGAERVFRRVGGGDR